MKKLFLVGALALFGAMNAQEYKPTTGDVTVDFGVAGGLGNTSLNLPDQGFGAGAMFKGRYFKSENVAYRGTLFLSNDSTTKNPDDVTTVKNSGFGLGLGFGLEKHFTGTERLSPYVGGDIMLGFTNKSAKTTTTNGSSSSVIEVKGPNDFMFGVRGVFGADYYFAKRVFLGVEAGLGIMYKSEGDTTLKAPGVPDSTVKGGSNLTITPDVVTGIRLGYAF